MDCELKRVEEERARIQHEETGTPYGASEGRRGAKKQPMEMTPITDALEKAASVITKGTTKNEDDQVPPTGSFWQQLYTEIKEAEKELFKNSKGMVFCVIWLLLLLTFGMAVYIMVLEKRGEVKHWEEHSESHHVTESHDGQQVETPKIRIRIRVPSMMDDENMFMGQGPTPDMIAQHLFGHDPVLQHLVGHSIRHHEEMPHANGMMVRRMIIRQGDGGSQQIILRSSQDALDNLFPQLDLMKVLSEGGLIKHLGTQGSHNLLGGGDIFGDDSESEKPKKALFLTPEMPDAQKQEEVIQSFKGKGFSSVDFHVCANGVDDFVEQERQKGVIYDHITDMGCMPKILHQQAVDHDGDGKTDTDAVTLFNRFMHTVDGLLSDDQKSVFQSVSGIQGKDLAHLAEHNEGHRMHLTSSDPANAPGLGITTWRKQGEL